MHEGSWSDIEAAINDHYSEQEGKAMIIYIKGTPYVIATETEIRTHRITIS